jgi:hypothetical protein
MKKLIIIEQKKEEEKIRDSTEDSRNSRELEGGTWQ